jgi:hypothetical protein
MSGGRFDEPIEVRGDADIPALLDVVHDEWIDLDHPEFGLRDGVVQLPFRYLAPARTILRRLGPLKRVRRNWLRGWLRVYSADSIDVADQARIGEGDVNTVAFNPTTATVTIECGVPVTIRIKVAELRLTANPTPEVVSMTESWTLRP